MSSREALLLDLHLLDEGERERGREGERGIFSRLCTSGILTVRRVGHGEATPIMLTRSPSLPSLAVSLEFRGAQLRSRKCTSVHVSSEDITKWNEEEEEEEEECMHLKRTYSQCHLCALPHHLRQLEPSFYALPRCTHEDDTATTPRPGLLAPVAWIEASSCRRWSGSRGRQCGD